MGRKEACRTSRRGTRHVAVAVLRQQGSAVVCTRSRREKLGVKKHSPTTDTKNNLVKQRCPRFNFNLMTTLALTTLATALMTRRTLLASIPMVVTTA